MLQVEAAHGRPSRIVQSAAHLAAVEVLLLDCRGVAERERRLLHRGDRPPEVDQHVPVLQEPLGLLVADFLSRPPLHRRLVVVDVRAPGRQAAVRRAGGVATHDVPEDKHPGCAGDLLHQGLDLRIVDLADRLLVGEVGHRGAAVQEHEAVLLQVQPVLDRPGVADHHRMVDRRPVGRLALARIEDRRLAGHDIGDDGADGAGFLGGSHGRVSSRIGRRLVSAAAV